VTEHRGSNPLVSVIMAAYNAEEYLQESLESVFAQDWQPFEVIVVDDGSVDRTAEIATSFAAVRYVHQENAGPAAARNTAAALATGAFVANFDSDDLLPPSRLSLQASYLIEHPNVGCVLGRQEWLNAPDWLPRDTIYGDIDGIPLSSAMFRREVLAALGGYDTAFTVGEDTDVLIRMRERAVDYTVLQDIVLYRRYHEGSLSSSRDPHSQLIRSLRAKLERGKHPS
jgi:glycosyltransferase involved in cell wall biosynthesis